MSYSEKQETEPEEPRGEDRFVVGSNALGLTANFDHIEQHPQDVDRSSSLEFSKGETCARSMIDESQNGLLFAVGRYECQIESPDEVSWEPPWPAVLEFLPQSEDLLPVVSNRSSDVGFVDRFLLRAMEVVERGGGLSAAVAGHEGLEPQDLSKEPGGFGCGPSVAEPFRNLLFGAMRATVCRADIRVSDSP